MCDFVSAVVEVDLTASSFKPGKPNYERVKSCLTENLDVQHRFAMTWASHRSTNTEENLLRDLGATRQECVADQELLRNFPLPVVRGEHPGGSVEGEAASSCGAGDFHTWLGVVSCGLLDSCGGTPGDFVSSFGPPEPHSTCQYGVRARWTGMVASSFINQTLNNARYASVDSILLGFALIFINTHCVQSEYWGCIHFCISLPETAGIYRRTSINCVVNFGF